MVRFLIILLFAITSCSTGIKTTMPLVGGDKIPLESDFFEKHYRQKYTIELPKGLDYNAIYVEAYYVNAVINEHVRIPAERALKFYKNGCVSNFYIIGFDLENLPELNPELRGARGMAYKKKGKYFMDLIVPINENYTIGKRPHEIIVKNDSLFVTYLRGNSTIIYLKKPLSAKNKAYKANW